jgi:DnaJ-domain-containing protein 1
MAKQKRSDDWGFPRWRSYGSKGRDAARLRLCDREGCSEIGDRPAPKAPNSKERWYFCEAHAAEYNKNWNYFAGLSPEEAARREAEDSRGAAGFRQSAQWKWAGPGDGSRSRDEMRALDALELDPDADFAAVKAAHRRLVKEHHPDRKPGDQEAAKRFKQVQAAYDVLRKAEERRADQAAAE